MSGREINFLGATKSDIENVDALLSKPFNQRCLQGGAGQPDIVPNYDVARFDNGGISTPNTSRDIVV